MMNLKQPLTMFDRVIVAVGPYVWRALFAVSIFLLFQYVEKMHHAKEHRFKGFPPSNARIAGVQGGAGGVMQGTGSMEPPENPGVYEYLDLKKLINKEGEPSPTQASPGPMFGYSEEPDYPPLASISPPKVASSVKPTFSAGNKYSSGDVVSYKVKKGDTLWLIATKCGVSIDALVKINDFKNADQIRVGQIIKIPETSLKSLDREDDQNND